MTESVSGPLIPVGASWHTAALRRRQLRLIPLSILIIFSAPSGSIMPDGAEVVAGQNLRRNLQNAGPGLVEVTFPKFAPEVEMFAAGLPKLG